MPLQLFPPFGIGAGPGRTGVVLSFINPSRWFYDVLRSLDYFRAAASLTAAAPDPRCEEAIEHVRSKRRDDGTWALDWSPTGRVWFEIDNGEDQPSRWVTLKALRVLEWRERH